MPGIIANRFREQTKVVCSFLLALRLYESAIELRGLTREMALVIDVQANLLNKRGKFRVPWTRTLELIARAGDAFPETAGLSRARGVALAGEGRYEAVAAFSGTSGNPEWNESSQRSDPANSKSTVGTLASPNLYLPTCQREE